MFIWILRKKLNSLRSGGTNNAKYHTFLFGEEAAFHAWREAANKCLKVREFTSLIAMLGK